MKKAFKIFAVSAVVAITFSSCAKDWTCTCKDSAGTTTSVGTYHTGKSSATSLCNLSAFTGETCTLAKK